MAKQFFYRCVQFLSSVFKPPYRWDSGGVVVISLTAKPARQECFLFFFFWGHFYGALPQAHVSGSLIHGCCLRT